MVARHRGRTLLIGLALLLSACGSPPPSDGDGGYGTLALHIMMGSPSSAVYRIHPMLAPAGVESVGVRVTGSGMSPVSAIFDATPGAAGSGTVTNVPAGGNRTVTVTYYDADNGGGAAVYRGTTAGVAVSAGSGATPVTVTVYSIEPGTVDLGFGDGGEITDAADGLASSGAGVRVDSHGRIVVAGTSSVTDSLATVWRFNADGSPDRTFEGAGNNTYYNHHAGLGAPAYVQALVLDSDDNPILVGKSAYQTSPSYGYRATAWRFRASNGAADATFGGSQPYVHRDCTLTNTSYSDARAAVLVQSGGKLVMAGSCSPTGSSFVLGLWRYDLDDTTWDNDVTTGDTEYFTYPTSQTSVGDIAIDSNGRYILAGETVSTSQMTIWVYVPTAHVIGTSENDDSSTLGFASAFGQSVAVAPGNHYVVVGGAQNATSFYMTAWKYQSSLSFDEDFAADGYYAYTEGGVTSGQANRVRLDSQNRLVIAGQADIPGESDTGVVWRLTSDGTLDTTFNADNGGYVVLPDSSSVNSLDFDEFGRIVVVGALGGSMKVWRINP